jgi:hypothetical protein
VIRVYDESGNVIEAHEHSYRRRALFCSGKAELILPRQIDFKNACWRFVVCADEKLTAFEELERAIHEFAVDLIS